jgi:tryptophan synthase alpha chain
MNAIEKKLERLRIRREGALIAYVCGGDPKPEYTPLIAAAMIRGGADIIELGIPFSDPIADGPSIQASSTRALRAKTTPLKVLENVSRVKQNYVDFPIALLTYYNPIFRIGIHRFFELANKHGVDGVIVPDLPIEEAGEYRRIAEDHGISTIFIATPNTEENRLMKIIDHSSGFLYLVSHFGVTGTKDELQKITLETIKRMLPYTSGRIPLAVGFGISKPEHVRTIISTGAQGAIIGSAFVKIIDEYQYDIEGIEKEIERKTSSFKAATRGVK